MYKLYKYDLTRGIRYNKLNIYRVNVSHDWAIFVVLVILGLIFILEPSKSYRKLINNETYNHVSFVSNL